jgi:hypothetical protein
MARIEKGFVDKNFLFPKNSCHQRGIYIKIINLDYIGEF